MTKEALYAENIAELNALPASQPEREALFAGWKAEREALIVRQQAEWKIPKTNQPERDALFIMWLIEWKALFARQEKEQDVLIARQRGTLIAKQKEENQSA